MIHHPQVALAGFDSLPSRNQHGTKRERRYYSPHNLATSWRCRNQLRFVRAPRDKCGSQYRNLGNRARDYGDPENHLSQWLIHRREVSCAKMRAEKISPHS
jgi:hypothetical protein